MSFADRYYEEKKKKKKQELTDQEKKAGGWFKGGAFEDGYDFGDITRTIIGSTADISENIFEAGVNLVESTVDTAAYGVGMIGGLFSEDFRDDVGEFISKDLLHAEEVSKYITMGTTPIGIFNKLLNDDAENASIFGDKSDQLVQSGAQLAAQVGLQAVGVPWWVTAGISSFGSEVESALGQGATFGEAGISGAITAGAELLTEKISGGIKFGGKALDDAVTDKLAKGISNKVVKSLLKFGWDATGEGAEEVLSGAISAIGQKITYADDKELNELFSFEDAFDSFIGGAVLGGGSSVINSVKNSRGGRDPLTALTANEQKVLDSVVAERVAEAEKDGKKLTKKEKNEIYDRVQEELKKGYIPTDTIEKVLGGDTYRSYQDTVSSEDAILKEFEELGNKTNPTLKEQARYAELQAKVKEIESNSRRSSLKTQLSEEVQKQLTRNVMGKTQTDNYLLESYNEQTRRGKKFEADVSKYGKNQAAVIQKAIDSGILNNTNRTHEFVDMIAKISADKGVIFDFANNEKIKNSGFAVDGNTVNGYVTKDGITLNIQSSKALNTVVGHEITHVLEGTELYSALQEAVTEYARAKGEYDGRYKALESLYKNVEGADINAELTADLVGDYLFTDKDFVNNLSVKHRNVFQKIYDEIKYLYKVATAGSKEARELEKVKRAFDKAYKESGKAQGDTKYSFSENNKKSLDKYTEKQYNDFGWARDTEAITKNELDDLYSKINEKGSLKKFPKSSSGEAIIEVNDNPHTTLGVDNVFVFVSGTKDNPQINKVARFQVETDTEMEIIKEKLYERGSFSNTYYSFLKQYGFAREYSKKSALDYTGYEEKVWRRSVGTESDRAYGNRGIEQNGSGTFEQTQSNEIAPINKASSTDGVFFDGKKRKYSLSAEGEAPKRYGNYNVSGKDIEFFAPTKEDLDAMRQETASAVENLGPIGANTSEQSDIAPRSKNAADAKFSLSEADNIDPVAKEYLSMEDFVNRDSSVWKNVDYNDEATQKSIMQETHTEMVKYGSVVKVYEDVINDVEQSYPDLRGMKKKDRLPILKESMNKLKNNIRQFLNGFKNQGFEFEVNGKVLEAKLYNTGINEVLEKITQEKASMLYTTEEIFKNARYLYSTQDYDSDPNVYRWNYFYSPVQIGNETVGVRIAVRDLAKQGESQIYNWNIKKDTSLDGVGGDSTNRKSHGVSSDVSNSSISQDLDSVKSETEFPENFAPTAEDLAPAAQDLGPRAEKNIADDSPRITTGMNEDERYEILKNKNITISAKTDETKLESVLNKLAITENDIDLAKYGDKKRLFKKLGEEFEVFKQYNNPDTKVTFSFSRGGISESVSKQQKGYMRLAKLLTCIDSVIENAVGIETHNRNAEGYKADASLKNVYVLASAFEDGDSVIPVKLEVKEFSDKENTLYVAIALESIKKNEIVKQEVAKDGVAQQYSPSFTISIADFLRKINPSDESFYKYIPKKLIQPNTESETAEILTESPEKPKEKSRIWSKFKTYVVDKGSAFEKLSLKTKNRELMGKWNYMLYSEARAQRLMGNGTEGVKSLNDIRAEVESTGRKKQFYEYMYHLHNVDRMSLEQKAKAQAEQLLKEDPLLKELNRRNTITEIMEKIDDNTSQITIDEMMNGDILEKNNDLFSSGDSKKEAAQDLFNKVRELISLKRVKNKPVLGDSYTAEMSQKLVEQYEAENPKFKEYAQDVYGYMNYLRGQMVKSGVISQETAELWTKMYPHYVPISREGSEGLSVNVPLYTGRTGVNAPIKRAKGGNGDILPLFDTMATRTEQTYRAIARNNFGIELKNTLGTTVNKSKASLDESIDSVDDNQEFLKKGDNGRKPTFTVFENGERVEFEITEDMYDALKPVSDLLRTTVKPLNTVSNLHRGILTEYNPAFMATNAIKDAQDVLINSQHPVQTYKNLPKAIKELKTKGKWYTEYMENGGEQNTYFDGKTQTFKAEDKKFVKIIGMPLRAISTANNFIERMPRLAEYIASREAGASVEVAMLDSARVTTNFAAGGDVTKFLNRNGATFLNASVQGLNQQVRNIKEAKVKGLKGWAGLLGKVAIAGLPAVLLNNLLWDDDEDYEELSDYVKDNYYIVAKYGDGQFVRLPKGRTVAVVQNAFEQAGDAVTGDDELDFNRFFDLFLTNLAPNDPIDNNIFSPISDVAKNETWYGEDLVPARLQDLPAAEQYDESTDSLSKWLGETFNYSPYKINYLLDQYSGGIGDVILPYMTPEADGGGIFAPLTDKFTTDSVMNNQNVSDFYDTVDELTTNAKSSYATDNDILKYKYINSVSGELSDLYAQKREIQNSSMDDSEKLEAVRDIQKQIDKLAKEAQETYNNVEISGDYATIGDRYYKLNDDGEWVKIADRMSEYKFSIEHPEKYAVVKAIGGYKAYKRYSGELYKIKADKDRNGNAISGSRKKKVIEYINGLDADYGEKIILFRSEYKSDDTYNRDILEYLNSREDISYDEMVAILTELGFKIGSDGKTVRW